MMRFQLDVLPASTELKAAFAHLYEKKQSGLVVATGTGDFRLISFDHMTEALAHGAERLENVNGQHLLSLDGIAQSDHDETLRKMGATIGLITAGGEMADLFSVSESIASRLTWASSVLRCDRPGKPAGRTAQSWYHYYPPNNPKSARPHACVAMGCNGTVR